MTLSLADLSGVSSTALLTLHGRAQGPLDDPEATRLVALLNPALRDSQVPMHQFLARRRVQLPLSQYLCMRATHFDRRARAFAAAHANAVVVNLAAGLDTRFHRLGGEIEVIDVDLPPMIALKRELLAIRPRYRMVEGSVTQRDWMAEVPLDRPVLFCAEGLFMYLPPGAVGDLLLALAQRFPGAELVAEVFQSRWLHGPLAWVVQRRLRKALRFDGDVVFQSGIRSSDAFEALGAGIAHLGDWSPADDVPGATLWRRIPFLRESQWVVHYRLGDA